MYDSFSKGTVKPEKRTIASFLRNQASAKRFSSDITLISPAVSARGSSTVVVRETEITFSQTRNVRKDVSYQEKSLFRRELYICGTYMHDGSINGGINEAI